MSAAAPKIGMIVLKTDETIENESRFYLRDSRAHLLVSRVTISDKINHDTLQETRRHLQQSLALFPEKYEFDVIAYACTSAATVIGEQEVAADLQRGCRARHATNPLTAAKAALRHIGARRIAYLAPYVSEVATAMQDTFSRAGFTLAARHSFGIESDHAVAALPPEEILQAVMRVGAADSDSDAVFIACTNLNCAAIIPAAEEQLGKTVISSNQALLWHILTLAQAPLPATAGLGRLFQSR